MPRVIKGYVIEVRPDHDKFYITTRTEQELRLLEARNLEKAIRRHCDDVVDTDVVPDPRLTVCSYCGSHWTEDSPDYNGGCCAKDEQHNPHPEAAQ